MITNSGTSAAAWGTSYAFYDFEGSKWSTTGGVLLGDGFDPSQPTYKFLLPPPSLAAGTRELVGLSIKIYGDGGSFGGGDAYISGINVGQLSTSESWNTFTYTGSSARALLTYAGAGKPYELTVTLDVTATEDQFDLKEIVVEYTYRGVPVEALRGYHLAAGAEAGISRFRNTIGAQWNGGQGLNKDFFTRAMMDTLSGLLSEVVWGAIPLKDSWKDLISSPFDFGSLFDQLVPVQTSLDWFFFWFTTPMLPSPNVWLEDASSALSELQSS